MTQNKKKLYTFNERERIDNGGKMLASLNNQTESMWVENVLLQAIMPNNAQARWLAYDYLLPDDGSVQKTLAAMFQASAAGLNVPNLRAFVEFSRKLELQNRSCLSGVEPQIYHLVEQARNIGDFLQKNGQKNRLDDDVFLLNGLIHDLENSPSSCIIFNFYNVLLGNWDILQPLSITYRLLNDLVTISNEIGGTLESRAQLLILLKNESENWSERAFHAN